MDRYLHANLKCFNVAPIRGCAEYSLGVDLWLIQGICDSGSFAKESSSLIQSLLE